MAQSELYGIMEQVKSQIVALELTGIPDANIVLCGMPSVAIVSSPAIQYPAIAIGPYGAEEVVAATNLRDDLRYPVLVAICDTLVSSAQAEQPGDKQTQGVDMRLYWRERIRKAFSNQRLTASIGMIVEVQPLAIVEPAAFQRDLWVSSLLLRIKNREVRT